MNEEGEMVEKREENGDNAHERPEFQVSHFWEKSNNDNFK